MTPDPKVVAKALSELAETVKQVMHVSNPRPGTLSNDDILAINFTQN